MRFVEVNATSFVIRTSVPMVVWRRTLALMLALHPVCLVATAADDNPSSGTTNSAARWQRRGQFVHDPSTIVSGFEEMGRRAEAILHASSLDDQRRCGFPRLFLGTRCNPFEESILALLFGVDLG